MCADDLAREVPNWDQVNNSPQFAYWLDQIDPISHRARRDFLNSAHNGNQTCQVVDIFRSFLSTLAPNGPANSAANPGNGAGGYTPASTPQIPDPDAICSTGKSEDRANEKSPSRRADLQRGGHTQILPRQDARQVCWAWKLKEADAIERPCSSGW